MITIEPRVCIGNCHGSCVACLFENSTYLHLRVSRVTDGKGLTANYRGQKLP